MTALGSDVWCTTEYVSGRIARGHTALAHALFRRITTARGVLAFVGGEAEANYGIDITDYIGRTDAEAAALALPAVVSGELRKDDRVVDVVVQAAIARGDDGLDDITLEIEVLPVDADETLTLSVRADSVSAQLLGVA